MHASTSSSVSSVNACAAIRATTTQQAFTLPESGSLPSARRFAECFLLGTRQRSLCRVPHSAKKPLPSAALGKVLLSVMTAFAESRTLGTGIHSTKGGSRQRVVRRRLKLTVVTFAKSRVLALGKEYSLPSAPCLTIGRASFAECRSWTLGKVYFYFFILPTKLFVVYSYYVDLHVPFWDNYKSVFYNY
jgi:hypothetical protein